MRERLPRPKDLVKEYIRDRGSPVDELTHMLYDFAYWMEGQDRPDMHCRYHVKPAVEDECPFDVEWRQEFAKEVSGD